MAADERPLNVGLIGLGGVAEAHLAGAVHARGVRVVAGADLDAGRLEEMNDTAWNGGLTHD